MWKKLIICIDDDKTILDSLKAQLKKNFGNEYVYEFAESADEALEVIEDIAQDQTETFIVVSDWLMPGMKGDEFLIELHKKYPYSKKMLLTGQAEQNAINRAKKHADLYKYLAKPWEEKDLINAIDGALKSL